MMAMLLAWKGRLQNFCERHHIVMRILIRGLIMLAVLTVESYRFTDGFFAKRSLLLLLIAVICAFLPDVVSIAVVAVDVFIEIGIISPIISVTMGAVLVIFFLMFGRRSKSQWYVLLAIPVLASVNISYTVPLTAALFATPAYIPAIVMGMIMEFAIRGSAEYTTTSYISSAGSTNLLSPLQYIFDYLLDNDRMWLAVFAFAVTFLCVYFIRRRAFAHSPQIALLTGGMVMLMVELIGNIIWDMGLDPIILIIDIISSMAIAYVVEFFHMTLDYRGMRRLQFEDDEYVYYVTAVPKISVAVADKTVTRILPDENDRDRDLLDEFSKEFEDEEDK